MYKILTIDGGGIKGVFPATILAGVEDTIGESVTDYFDLIVGTSTGGIIALGLGMGYSASDILRFYEELGPQIFQKKSHEAELGLKQRILLSQFPVGVQQHIKDVLPILRDTLYDAETLRKALEDLFQEKKLGDSKVRLVIPSFNIATGEVHVYKTRHHERFLRDFKEKVVDVAIATASAPIFFPTHFSSTGIPLVDGGIYANNPVGLAVVEAMAILGWKPEDFKVLSIGCTGSPFNVRTDKRELGLLDYGTKLIEIFMDAQSSYAMGTAKLLANDSQNRNIFRIDHQVTAGLYGLDKVAAIGQLKGLASSILRQEIPKVISSFFQEKAERFLPIPMMERKSS